MHEQRGHIRNCGHNARRTHRGPGRSRSGGVHTLSSPHIGGRRMLATQAPSRGWPQLCVVARCLDPRLGWARGYSIDQGAPPTVRRPAARLGSPHSVS
eukprot:scaffold161462_cov32-Tisochrysis_lutea.AAC.1